VRIDISMDKIRKVEDAREYITIVTFLPKNSDDKRILLDKLNEVAELIKIWF